MVDSNDIKVDRKTYFLIRKLMVVSLYLLGYNLRDIGIAVSMDKATIYKHVNAMNVPRRGYDFRYKHKIIK